VQYPMRYQPFSFAINPIGRQMGALIPWPLRRSIETGMPEPLTG
jgi:hypothetical protein